MDPSIVRIKVKDIEQMGQRGEDDHQILAEKTKCYKGRIAKDKLPFSDWLRCQS